MTTQKRILLVHGIYSREGESNVWNMKAPLEQATGLPVVVFEYGYMHPVQARFDNPRISRRLADVMEPGDIIVNHSNGAAVTYLATVKHGARPSGVVMINPALDEWRMPVCDWAHVYYNDADEVVWWSHLLPGNVWGEMGRVGFIPQGKRPPAWTRNRMALKDNGLTWQTSVLNTDTGISRIDAPAAKGHLAMFQSPCVQPWGKIVGGRILTEISDAA